jgi:hypothetical protein
MAVFPPLDTKIGACFAPMPVFSDFSSDDVFMYYGATLRRLLWH